MEHPKKALKFDEQKPSIGLIPHKALVDIAQVFDFGAKKYGRYNFRSGLKYSRLIDAAYRHLGAFNDGEDIDSESGKSHIAHLGCCIIMLLTAMHEHKELDDRYGKTEGTLGTRVSEGGESESQERTQTSEERIITDEQAESQARGIMEYCSRLSDPNGTIKYVD